MKKNIIILVAIAIIIILTLVSQKNPQSNLLDTTQVCIKETCIEAELPATSEEFQTGLMHRTSLDNNKGMFFIFKTERKHNFWMKNTLIPLDIIWINKNKEIIFIEHALPCQSNPCPSYGPNLNSAFVLEVNQNFTIRNNIQIGDKIDF